MKKNRIWIYIIVLLAFIGVNKLVYDYLNDNYKDNNQLVEETEQEQEVSPAMDFIVKDVNGYNVRLSSQFGKPIVLNFWTSWCPNCAEQLVGMQNLYEEYEDRVTFFMVNVTDGVKETITDGKEYIADKGYTFPVYYDINFQASSTYGASSIPITYLIDADGNIAAYGMGTLNEEVIKSYLDGLVE